MRTFIALEFIPEYFLLGKLAEIKHLLINESIKWVEEKNFHLTLKFLGEITESQSDSIKNLLMDFAARQNPVSFSPAGFGYFKRNGIPQVLFVDLKNTIALQKMAEEIDALLLPFGFRQESRPFNPHLTVGRIKYLKNKQAFYKVAELYREIILEPVVVHEIIFFQSILQPGGPVYHALGRFPLFGQS